MFSQEYMAGGTLKDLVVEAYFDAHPHRLYMRQARQPNAFPRNSRAQWVLIEVY